MESGQLARQHTVCVCGLAVTETPSVRYNNDTVPLNQLAANQALVISPFEADTFPTCITQLRCTFRYPSLGRTIPRKQLARLPALRANSEDT